MVSEAYEDECVEDEDEKNVEDEARTGRQSTSIIAKTVENVQLVIGKDSRLSAFTDHTVNRHYRIQTYERERNKEDSE